MTKYTINELANSKGVSQPVREALLQMADYKQLYEQVCEQYDVLAKEFEAIKQALAAPVQEPLHDEKVRLIAHNECPEDWDSLDNKECWLKGFVSGFKTAERERKA